MQGAQPLVENTMLGTGWDVDAFRGIHRDLLPFHFKSGGTQKDVKKLLGVLVVVRFFRGAGRHHFLDHTQAIGFEQVPALALVTPLIMFGVVKGSL